MRHIARATRNTRMDFLYLNYRLLKLDDLFRFELGKFMHKFHNGMLPQSFLGYFSELSEIRTRTTRASQRRDFYVPRCSCKMGERLLKIQGAKLWNGLPMTVKNETIAKFKDKMKDHIFSQF